MSKWPNLILALRIRKCPPTRALVEYFPHFYVAKLNTHARGKCQQNRKLPRSMSDDIYTLHISTYFTFTGWRLRRRLATLFNFARPLTHTHSHTHTVLGSRFPSSAAFVITKSTSSSPLSSSQCAPDNLPQSLPYVNQYRLIEQINSTNIILCAFVNKYKKCAEMKNKTKKKYTEIRRGRPR